MCWAGPWDCHCSAKNFSYWIYPVNERSAPNDSRCGTPLGRGKLRQQSYVRRGQQANPFHRGLWERIFAAVRWVLIDRPKGSLAICCHDF